jgi:aspartate racemase
MSNEDISDLRKKLTQAQQALIEKWLREAQAGVNKTQTIPRQPHQGTVPLSYGQQWFWYCLERWSHGRPGPVYLLPAAVRLKGALNVAALEQALNAIIERHEAVRTTFKVADGRRVQVIAPSLKLELPVIDLRALPVDVRETEAARLIFEEARRLFDLARGPLLRAALLRLADDAQIVLLTMHHIITDGWSQAIFSRELTALYAAFSEGRPSPLPDLPIQYADYSIWQQQKFHQDALQHQLSYWMRELAGAPLILELPIDNPRPAIQTSRGGKQKLVIPKAMAEPLRELSYRAKGTLFVTLLSAFNVLLYRYTGQQDILVGTPVAGRTRVELETLIGYFVNNLVLRTDLSGDPTFLEFLEREREMVLRAFAHQDVPFVKLVEALHPEPDLSRSPVIQVLFVIENTPPPILKLPGLSTEFLSTDNGTATRDLSLVLVDEMEALTATFIYNGDLFEPETVKRMLASFQTLLSSVITNPQQRLSSLLRHI